MSNIFLVMLFAALGGALSLVGGFFLLKNKKSANAIANYATPFAAGALLAAAFTDLLPEAIHDGQTETALYATLGGILGFFLLERFLHWFHHHHVHEGAISKSDPNVSLVIIGDTMHNFIDGIAIAAGFLVDMQTGMVVTLAVAAHEIPQEIGDFGLLLKKGLSKANVIKVNFLSAIATVVSAGIFFTLGEQTNLRLDILLGFVAGFFIYIATSDIIPSIHSTEEHKLATKQTALLVIGVVSVIIVTSVLHGLIDQEVSISLITSI